MIEIVTFLGYILSFLVVLSIVVIVHEWGHFFAARRCGVDVVTFSIGFGKRLWSRTDKKGTVWQVCAVPLGGYVQMLGDEDAASAKQSDKNLTPEQKAKTFMVQPLWKRATIIFAGPFMNYFFAIVALAIILSTVGYIRTPALIGTVLPDSVAEQAGIQQGDLITAIDGKVVQDFSDIKRAVVISNFGQEMTLTIKRGDDVLQKKVLPQPLKEGELPMLGVMAASDVELTYERYALPMAIVKATTMTYDITVDTVQYLGQVLSGKRSADDMRGPVGIAEASGDAAKAGVFVFVLFLIQVSIGIGFVNLLPIPLLDGGHLALYGVEAVTGKPLNERTQTLLLRTGIALLIFIFAFTLLKDVPRVLERIF